MITLFFFFLFCFVLFFCVCVCGGGGGGLFFFLRSAASNQGIHCFHRPVCLNTLGYYGVCIVIGILK